MKLKKIASLMLAGVMAVSMLSACGEGSGNGNGNEDENKPVETVSNAVTYANNGQIFWRCQDSFPALLWTAGLKSHRCVWQ